MKKIKWILTTTAITNAAVTPLCFSLTSCSVKEEAHTQEVYEKSIEYFVGENYTGGICSIPHETHNLDAIRDFIIQKAKECGIPDESIFKDAYGNMWYDIPATKGCENWKKLCLQAHMDMVWELKDSQNKITHPEPVLDTKDGKEVIHTKNFQSSLGADDGAGVAMMLAITANKNISHGIIRCIFTADEETGMNGASVIGKMSDGTYINVVDHEEGFDYMLNLDAENEGDVFISCAGGYSGKYTLTFKTGEEGASVETISENEELYQLDIQGGMGGHSGMNMINNPINAVITGTQFLSNTLPSLEDDIKLVKIDSYETVGNVIPAKSTFIFTLPKLSTQEEKDKRLEIFREILKDFIDDVKLFHPKEKNLSAIIDEYKGTKTFTYELGDKNTKEIFSLINNLMFGAQQVRELPDGTKELVSSSNVCPVNLDLTKTDKVNPYFDFMIFDRSEDLEYLFENYILYTTEILKYFKDKCDGDVNWHIEKKSQYPAYVYNPSDRIRVKVFDAYKDLKIKPKEQRTHGGIECAWWYTYNNDIQQASIGPTITDVHNHNETLYLDSYRKLSSVVLHVINQMKNM